jgi:hypothetical protein
MRTLVPMATREALRRLRGSPFDAQVKSRLRCSCGLIADCGTPYGLFAVLRQRVRGLADQRKTRVGVVGLESMTCGFYIPDSPSTQHAPRGSSGGYDSGRRPVSSANVPARTTGGPRRARTDDLRIKRSLSGLWAMMCCRVKRWRCSGMPLMVDGGGVWSTVVLCTGCVLT